MSGQVQIKRMITQTYQIAWSITPKIWLLFIGLCLSLAILNTVNMFTFDHEGFAYEIVDIAIGIIYVAVSAYIYVIVFDQIFGVDELKTSRALRTRKVFYTSLLLGLLAIFLVLILLIIYILFFILLMILTGASDALEVLEQEPNLAQIWGIMGPASWLIAGAVLIAIFGFLFWIGSRLTLISLATWRTGQIMIFRTWPLTKGSGLKIMIAGFCTTILFTLLAGSINFAFLDPFMTSTSSWLYCFIAAYACYLIEFPALLLGLGLVISAYRQLNPDFEALKTAPDKVETF